VRQQPDDFSNIRDSKSFVAHHSFPSASLRPQNRLLTDYWNQDAGCTSASVGCRSISRSRWPILHRLHHGGEPRLDGIEPRVRRLRHLARAGLSQRGGAALRGLLESFEGVAFGSVSYFVLRLRLLADRAANFCDVPALMRVRPRRERFHPLNLAGRHAHERLFSGNGDMARLTTNRADQE
jgi:hypothetical protein